MKAILFCSLIVLLISCSEQADVKVIKRVHVNTVNSPKKVKATSIAIFEIEGMTCEMGCGGSIRKELKSTGAVSRVQYDFIEGRKTQVTRIEYDSIQIDYHQIERIIESLNDHQFKAKFVSDELLSAQPNAFNNSIEQKECEKNCITSISEQTLQIPSLFEVLGTSLL